MVSGANSLADPAAFDKLMAALDGDAAAYGRAGAQLCGAIRSLIQEAAFGAVSPAEKVGCLHRAKAALAALEAAVRYTPRADGYDVSLTGLEETRAALAALEATFTAFGWMREGHG